MWPSYRQGHNNLVQFTNFADSQLFPSGNVENAQKTGNSVKAMFFSEPNRQHIKTLAKQKDSRFFMSDAMSGSTMTQYMWLFYNSFLPFRGTVDNGGLDPVQHVAILNDQVASELVNLFKIGSWGQERYMADRYGPKQYPEYGVSTRDTNTKNLTRGNDDSSRIIFGPSDCDSPAYLQNFCWNE